MTKRAKNKPIRKEKAPPDYSDPLIIKSEELCKKLIEKNLSKYLMTDFPNNFINIKIKDESQAQEFQRLNSTMNAILMHLDLPLTVKLNIEYMDNNDRNTKGLAGTYQANHILLNTITLKIFDNQRPVSIIATLCHECTHYFMHYHKLDIENKLENEIRTDILANLIGFGKIMDYGYETFEGITIGYISSSECLKVYNFLIHKRKIFSEKTKLQKNINTAEILLEQLTFLYNNISNSKDVKITPQLIQAISYYENNEIINLLNHCKELKTNNINILKNNNKKILQCCSDMATYIHYFNSN